MYNVLAFPSNFSANKLQIVRGKANDTCVVRQN